MNINVKVTNMEISERLRVYVNQKLEDVLPAFGDMNLDPVVMDVELERTTFHHNKGENLYRAEVNVAVPGSLIRAEETSESPEGAVDAMKDTLTREVRKWREKKIDNDRKGAREAKRRLRGGDN